MERLLNEEGGLLRALYANALAIANSALNDNTCSEETKEVIQSLKIQTTIIYNLPNHTSISPPCSCKQLIQFTPCETVVSKEKMPDQIQIKEPTLQ